MWNSEQENVVSMDSYGQLRHGLDSSRGSQILRETARQACDELKTLMERMMDRVDDALFERAEKAENNALQKGYFDAMRELRIIRTDIEDRFLALFAAGFAEGISRDAVEPGRTAGHRPNQVLAPHDRDRLEEELAIVGIVNKIRGNCSDNLRILDKRVGFLMGDPDLRCSHNPLGPEAICGAFRRAASQIQAGLEIRLVVFKLFDQHVGSQADSLWGDINHYLVMMGVLPDLRAMPRMPPLRALPAGDPLFRDDGAAGGNDEAMPDWSAIPMAAGIQPCYRNMVQLPDAASVPLARGIQPFYRSRPGSPDAVSVPMAEGIEPSRGVCTPMPPTLSACDQQGEWGTDARVVAVQSRKGPEAPEPSAVGGIQHGSDGDNLHFVREFIATHWKRLLFVTCARHGKDSEAWRQAVRTMDELIWSVKSTHTAEEHHRLREIQPRLLRNLRQGMERLLVPQAEREDFIARLAHAHGAAQTCDEASGPQQCQASQASPEPPASARPGPAASIGRAAGVQPLHSSGERFEAMAQRLKPGDWVEFRSSDGTGRQAKLSWVSPITGTLLFTDREGLKAGNHSIEALAHLLRCSRAHVLEAAPVTDRDPGMYRKPA